MGLHVVCFGLNICQACNNIIKHTTPTLINPPHLFIPPQTIHTLSICVP